MSHALDHGRTDLIQAVERVLSRINTDVQDDLHRQEAEWQRRYDDLQTSADEARVHLEANIDDLLKKIATLSSTLSKQQASQTPQRLDQANFAGAGNSSNGSDGPGGPDGRDNSNGTSNGPDVGQVAAETGTIADAPATDLRAGLDKARRRYESVKEQLASVVALAQRRKAEAVAWKEYAESLERKIQRHATKQACRRSATVAETRPLTDATTGTPLAGTIGAADAVDSAEVEAFGINLQNSVARKMPPLPLLPPQATDVPRPSLGGCSGSSSFTRGPVVSYQKDDAHPGPDAATMESTQGDPSSDDAQPELPMPRPLRSDDAAMDPPHESTVKQEPLSDPPEVIWERPAKRPKQDDTEGRGAARDRARPLAVKRESSGINASAWGLGGTYYGSQESIDLDEGQLTVRTPRKRHLFFNLGSRPEEDDDESGDDDDNGNPDKDDDNLRIHTSRKAPMAAAPVPALTSTPTPRQAGHSPLPAPRRLGTPLAPLSVNVRRGAQDVVGDAKPRKRRIEALAEDGTLYTTDGTSPQRRAAADAASTAAKPSRLQALLDTPSASLQSYRASPTKMSATAVKAARPRRHGLQSPIAGLFGCPPPTRILPRLRDGISNVSPGTPGAGAHERTAARLSVMPGTRTRDALVPAQLGPGSGLKPGQRLRSEVSASTPTPTTPTIRPLTAALLAAKAESAAHKAATATPLRGRPMAQLRAEDFKVNPATNNGETFAYSEVVRGRASRAGLAGCTDAQCCGPTFRAMAQSELDAADAAAARDVTDGADGAGGGGAGARAHISRPDSVVMMERHLGDEAFLLARMAPDEKRMLWLEARTHELADKYGKHRHRYHRRASPPGFWDTEFPATQEAARNAAEAARVERALVQERYREAMRPGGRWLFRDE